MGMTIEIPNGSTNGDAIKALFPNKQFVSICSDRIYDFTTDNKIDCDLDWWNAEYKEPTTKNDLGVDCIDKQATLDAIIKRLGISNESYLLPAEKTIYQQIKDMPSVTPQEPRCKNCKWWKDNDGVYRRGVEAESLCPINRQEVYEGNGYCFLFEPQESEDKE